MTRRLTFSAILLLILLASGCGGKDAPTKPELRGQALTLPATVTGLSGAKGSQKLYRVTVPPGTFELRIATTGGSGDVDIYALFNEEPTVSNFDCAADTFGNDDECIISSPDDGTWYIMLDAADAYTGVTLWVTVAVD
jgi:hypothetical protein